MFDAASIDEVALRRGFKRRGKKNWVRRTADFVQLVNLQGSAWSRDVSYVNFALWPLALGEPNSLAESKFLFRTRAGGLGASSPEALFNSADRLQSLADLRAALAARKVTGLLTVQLRDLLDSRS
jgi:uncharacterized protein DUF4304